MQVYLFGMYYQNKTKNTSETFTIFMQLYNKKAIYGKQILTILNNSDPRVSTCKITTYDYNVSEWLRVSDSEWVTLSEWLCVSDSEWMTLSEWLWVSDSEWVTLSEWLWVSDSV